MNEHSCQVRPTASSRKRLFVSRQERSFHNRASTMSSSSIESLASEDARRRAIVLALLGEVQDLSPALRDQRLIRRFAETRGFSFGKTLVLLRQYASYRIERGLDDDSLPRSPGVSHEMRKRHTMRLLDPRKSPTTTTHTPQQTEQQQQALTFLQLSTPSLWPTARDNDRCPVIYTSVEQYVRNDKAVESLLVWTCELVCREMDAEMDDDGDDANSENSKKQFTILLDMTNAKHVHLPALCRLGEILQRALKRGFRGRLHKFYMYPTGRKGRILLRVIKPLLGRYTPPKIKLLDRKNQNELIEIFPKEILPPSLGGTSRLLSVQFHDTSSEGLDKSDDVKTSYTTASTEGDTKQNGDPFGGVHGVAPNATNEENSEHNDLKWFLKVPALNFAVMGVVTACSIRCAPQIPPSGRVRMETVGTTDLWGKPNWGTPTPRAGEKQKRAKRWAHAVAILATNVLTWRTIGWDVCGIERSGVWSAAVMLVIGVWRGRDRSESEERRIARKYRIQGSFTL